MNRSRPFAEWLGVREAEVRVVLLSFAGAFLVMSFLVLARALREAAYLAQFDAATLPYVMGGVVVLGFPAAARFSNALSRVSARRAMRAFSLLLAVAVAAVWPFLTGSPVAIVAFYLLTAVGTVILTSGFWLVVSDMLVVREAKRLFGLISAGGTAGMLVTGLAVGVAVRRWDPLLLVPALVLILLLFAALNEFVPRGRASSSPSGARARWTDSVGLIARNRHVRTLTLVVLLVAAAGTIVDFQFKEAAQDVIGGERDLAAFFGAFYAWMGGLALVVQLLLTTRIMSRGGIAWSIALLPAILAIVSVGMLLVPGIVVATALRGSDGAIKKSLFRSVVEFLWVPVRTDVRRKTKTFVDTMAENAGDGIGALIVLVMVTLGGAPSRYLAIVVMLLCFVLLWLARRMGAEYLSTLRLRLAEGASRQALADRPPGRDIEPRTLSRIDVTRLLSSIEAEALRTGSTDPRERETDDADAGDAGGLPAPTVLDDEALKRRLQASAPFNAGDVPRLALILARDDVRDLAARRLAAMGEAAGPALAAIVADEGADFVVRRRVAQVLAAVPGEAALDGLLAGLHANRFEIRYRAARALERRRWAGEPRSPEVDEAVWSAIRRELSRGRAVWEIARLLDPVEHDELAGGRAAQRGQLSLDYVFRLLGLVLDADAIRTAWRGLSGDHPELASLALEYLEQVLPDDVRRKLWPFIGDLSPEQSRRAIRPLDMVVNDLLVTGATLFRDEDRRHLQQFLRAPGDAGDTEASADSDNDGPADAG